MKPDEVDELSDEMQAAMIRRMEAEAEAIRKTNAQTKLPR